MSAIERPPSSSLGSSWTAIDREDRLRRRRQGDAGRRRRSCSRRATPAGLEVVVSASTRRCSNGRRWMGRPLGPQHLRRRRAPPARPDGRARHPADELGGRLCVRDGRVRRRGDESCSPEPSVVARGTARTAVARSDSFEASLLRGKRLGIVGYGAVGRSSRRQHERSGWRCGRPSDHHCSSAASRSTASCLRTRSTSCSPRATSSPCAPR